ncbi:MAG: class I SAM-dependent methyltransferase [Burkholderiaceae bacterium]
MNELNDTRRQQHDIDGPSPWVLRFAPLIASGGAILDVACGRGRHARWFESRGHRVTGIDRDEAVLAVSGASERIVCDLEGSEDPGGKWPLHGRRYAGVIVTNYLHRPLFPLLIDALAESGVLIYETFAIGNARFGKPANPDFLLQRGELLARCLELDVVAYEDGLVTHPKPASIQRICAIRDADRLERHTL